MTNDTKDAAPSIFISYAQPARGGKENRIPPMLRQVGAAFSRPTGGTLARRRSHGSRKNLVYCVFNLLARRNGVMAEEAFAGRKLYGPYAYSFQGQITGKFPVSVAAVGVMHVHWHGDSPTIAPEDIEGFEEVEFDESHILVFAIGGHHDQH